MKQLFFRCFRQDFVLVFFCCLRNSKQRNSKSEVCYYIFQEDFFWVLCGYSFKVIYNVCLYLLGLEIVNLEKDLVYFSCKVQFLWLMVQSRGRDVGLSLIDQQ